MSNEKELGAKQMFEQSLVYLYNSYREDGVSKDKSSQLVKAEMERVYAKYEEMGVLDKSQVIANPGTRIDEVIRDIEMTDRTDWRTLSPMKQSAKYETLLKSLAMKLKRVKSLLK